jgi:hypothetical protein
VFRVKSSPFNGHRWGAAGSNPIKATEAATQKVVSAIRHQLTREAVGTAVPSIAKSRGRIRTRLLLDKWRSQPPLHISSFDQRNSDRMFCESELAIESDWIASCCWVCSEGEDFHQLVGGAQKG